jgi:UDP-GlcNAc:undecaprenyl-phosphate GlcNAc-1-phosphate transferase
VAIFVAFYLPLAVTALFSPRTFHKILNHPELLWIFLGSTLVFLMGLRDDVHRLDPRIKLAVQAAAALIAYMGGVRISHLIFPWGTEYFLGWLSLPVTVFWFLLVINAINLIDGLDGLAAGVSLFAALTLIALSLMGGHFSVALGLAALAGTCLGFLRYNFNPASIFMGDCGSYFLGYMLSALSILGSIKSHAAVAILIPVIALGLPLMDTVLAPIRRFVAGSAMFKPDKNHIHHRLLKMGFSHRKAVLSMYGATLMLGAFALLAVHSQDEQAGLILSILGMTVVFAVRKLGYLRIFAVDKIVGYLQDVGDEMGFNRDRRTFLSRQVAISEADNPTEMWNRVTDALILLKIDEAEIRYNGVSFHAPRKGDCKWCVKSVVRNLDGCAHRVLSLDLPLVDEKLSYGTLYLKKDIVHDPISHYTLRRIEHLRRSIVTKLNSFEEIAHKAKSGSIGEVAAQTGNPTEAKAARM